MFTRSCPINKLRFMAISSLIAASLAMVLPTQAIAKLTTTQQPTHIAINTQPVVAQIRVSRTPPANVYTQVNPPSAAKNSMNNKNLQEARSRQEALRQERLDDMQKRGVNKPSKIRYQNTTPGGIRGIKRFTVEEVGR